MSFLPVRPARVVASPWLLSLSMLGTAAACVAGALAVRPIGPPEHADVHGAAATIELAEFVTTAASVARPDSVASNDQDQQAMPKLEDVRSQPAEQPDAPTEQASPIEADDPDLRLSQERTQKATEAPKDPTAQPTEASKPVQASQSAEASTASDAVAEQQATTPREQSAAPDQGNARDAQRWIEAWRRAVFAHVAKFKTYPEEARKRRHQGETVVHFIMTRDGVLTAIRISQGSGIAALDQAAVEVLRRASPLPPPPAALAGETLELLLPLRYQLR